MRWLRRMLLSMSVLAATPLAAQPNQSELVRATALWQSGDYAGAYTVLAANREENFGRSFEVDYMLGTSACRLPDPEKQQRGASFLRWAMNAYAHQLTAEGLSAVGREAGNCPPTAQQALAPVPKVQQIATAGGRYQGKTFYWLDSRTTDALGSHLTAGIVPVPAAQLAARQIKIGNDSGAMGIARQAIPAGSVRVFNRFVIASDAGHTEAQLRDANNILESYLAFFVKSYEMRPPDRYVFVFLTRDIDGLRKFAQRHHGLELKYGTIAYSLRDDLSLSAVIPSQSFGSLFHELFHLMARSNFGDIPNWLDEGIASLYEVSKITPEGFAGTPNWRGRILARFHESVPSLKILIDNRGARLLDTTTWQRSDIQREQVEEAVFSATGRYFALYLQEKGKLFDLYKAIRNYSTSDDFDGRNAGVVRRVRTVTGMPLETLNADFRKWLSKQERELNNLTVDQALDKYIPPAP